MSVAGTSDRRESGVHHLFLEQVARTPERAALRVADETLTYAELATRAREMSRRLRAMGVDRDVPVAVHLPRSSSMIIALLGVLEAGGAYVPIDPTWPEVRAARVLHDARPTVLITTTGMPAGTAEGQPTPWSVLDPHALPPVGPVGDAPPSSDGDRAGGEALAYVMYTSGSTGRPKGVAMPHRSLVNLLRWHHRARPGSPERRTLQLCSIGFDFSFHEIFSTLCFGGELVLAPDAARADPRALLSFLDEAAIARAFLPVSVLRQLAEVADGGRTPRRLVEVLTTGERLRIDGATRRFFRLTGACLHNHYGATEFQDALTLTLDGDPESWPDLPAAGLPLDGVRVTIRDDALAPCPDGVAGELYVSGAGIARGYHRQPALTAERFVELLDEPADQGSTRRRAYRTGDIARVGPGGAVEILGRVDDQVKVGGVRVEPAEIEQALAEHPEVRAAAVVAREDLPGLKRLVACIVPAGGTASDLAARLGSFLRSRLPGAMVPAGFVLLDALPLTASGKIDRRALLTAATPAGARPERPRGRKAVERHVLSVWRAVLDRQDVGPTDSFFEVGGTSLLAARLHSALFEVYGAVITSTTIFRHPTVRSLAEALSPAEAPPTAGVDAPDDPVARREDDVAVIGMACRFPGADDPDAFWANLVAGVESLTRFDDGELEQRNPALSGHPDYVKAGFVLDDIEGFDAGFFGYSARDAALIDPQHRILLECAWEAFEAAGYRPGRDTGRVGVFAGASPSTYLMNHVAPGLGFGDENPFIEADLQQFQLKMGNDRNYLATRISYTLDLVGPSVNVQSACSTALVAVHLARRSILGGECDLALAGGASLIVPQKGGYLYQEGMVRSPDGHCRAFDVDARGTLLANGVGAVLLKRLSHAVRDKDPIVAVIAGSAVGNDGGLKAGYAAPSVHGQAHTVAAAIRDAGIDSAEIGYVEAHGTGTALGDPVEVAGLNAAFRQTRTGADAPPCPLGSVKTNIGHLDEAAGIAGFIKTALVVRHGRVPPSLHYTAPNPAIDFADGPFYVNHTLSDWPRAAGLRYAGVSAMGVGGTNCHVVLREPPPRETPPASPGAEARLLPLSARSPQALRALAGRYAAHLGQPTAAALDDVCFTAGVGRTHFAHRLTARGESVDDLSAALAGFAETGACPSTMHIGEARSADGAPPRVAFVFPGLGANHVGMGRALYATASVFRECIDRCEALLAGTGLLSRSLTSVLFSDDPDDGALLDPAYAQPCLFAFEVALAAQLRGWGIEPDLVLGHSAGEFAAAHLAGVFDLTDGIWLTARRGQLLAQHPAPGGMLAVNAPIERVEALIAERDGLHIGVINSPADVVVSGDDQPLRALEETLRAEGVRVRRLDVPGAGHSPFQATMAEAFERAAGERALSAPGDAPALISTLTGRRADQPLPGEPGIDDPRYWRQHSAQTVRFADAIATCGAAGVDVFVEIGPRPVLLGLVRRCLPDHDGPVVPTLDPRQRPGAPAIGDRARLLDAAARLYVYGVDVDWAAISGRAGARRVPLPRYPWQRERHWFEAPDAGSRPGGRSPRRTGGHPLLGEPLALPGGAEVRYQTHVSRAHPPWMGDHRAFGALNMLGMGYLEMALAAGVELFDAPRIAVVDLTLEQPMPIAEDGGETAVQQVLRPEAGGYGFEVHSARSRADGRPGEWSRHASARVMPGAASRRAPSVDMAALLARHPESMTVEALRAHEHAAGAMLGDSFWVLDAIHLSPARDAALTAIRLGDVGGEPLAARRRYAIHPVYLEACFLSFTAAYPDGLRGSAYAPFHIEHVELDRDVRYTPDADTRLWCHLRRRPLMHGDGPPPLMTADLELLDDAGRILLTARGVHVRRTTGAAMLRTSAVPWHDWLYEVEWRPLVIEGDGRAESDAVVLVGEDDPTTARLTDLLGGGVRRLWLGSDAPSAAALHLLDDARDVVFVQGRAPEDAVDTADCVRLLHLCRALAERSGFGERRLWLVTFDACPAGDAAGDQPSPRRAPVGAALGGLAEVAGLEIPDLRVSRIDLCSAAIDDLERFGALFAATAAGSTDVLDRTVRVRGDGLWQPRLIRSQRAALLDPPARPDERVVVRPDRTYLVTGGLGGIGSKVVEWLVERGARHLVLVGRSAPSAAAESWLSALGEVVEQVLTRQVDVTRRSEVDALLAEIERTLPPLAGLCHAAGVADDAPIAALEPEALQRVLGPKLCGAWHLHRASVGLELDWFVLFSSASVLLTGPGQAAYVAANRFLDALAHHRVALGLPALSVDWGTWREVGMAADMDLDAWSRRSGEDTLSPDQGIRALERVLDAAVWARRFGAPPPVQVAVMPARWPDIFARRGRVPALLSEMRGAERAEPGDVPLVDQLTALPREARAEWLVGAVRAQIGAILGLSDPAGLTPDTALADLGFDSLTMIELSRWVSRTFAVRVRSTALYDALSTIERLAQHVLAEREPEGAAAPATAEASRALEYTESGRIRLAPTRATPRCIMTLRGSGEEPPFILFSALGGSAHVFFDLVRALRPTLPVWAVEAPETVGHPASPPSMQGLATLIADELTSRPDRPRRLRLAGFSFGAYAAIETARILVERGVAVEALVAIDVEPVVGAVGEQLLDRELSLAFLARQAGVDPKQWGPVPLEERVRLLAERLGTDKADRRSMEQEIWQIVAAARSNRERLSGWRVRDPGVPVTLVWTDEIAASLPRWRDLLGERLRAVHVPGDHAACMREPIVQAVARALESSLAADGAQKPTPT